MKINRKKGILFWITFVWIRKINDSKFNKDKIEKKYGPTIIMSGDDQDV